MRGVDEVREFFEEIGDGEWNRVDQDGRGRAAFEFTAGSVALSHAGWDAAVMERRLVAYGRPSCPTLGEISSTAGQLPFAVLGVSASNFLPSGDPDVIARIERTLRCGGSSSTGWRSTARSPAPSTAPRICCSHSNAKSPYHPTFSSGAADVPRCKGAVVFRAELRVAQGAMEGDRFRLGGRGLAVERHVQRRSRVTVCRRCRCC